MPTKQELKNFIDELRKSMPIMVLTNEEYARGIFTTLNVIEQEYNLNNIGENNEG